MILVYDKGNCHCQICHFCVVGYLQTTLLRSSGYRLQNCNMAVKQILIKKENLGPRRLRPRVEAGKTMVCCWAA